MHVTASRSLPVKKTAGHIFGLDGLRAIAVLAVVFYHLFPTLLPGGYIGVDIFFVISGFLITSLLVSEHTQTGRISLKKFWLRRARRLLPALFITILVISSIVFFVRGDIMVGIGQQILGASTFSSNWMEVAAGANYFSNNTTHLFMNFWSLAVEEQFYLLWPLIVLLLVAVIKKPVVGMLLTAVLGIASAGLMAWLFWHGTNETRLYYGTDTHVFGLMIGAMLAFWSRALTQGEPFRRHSQHFWFLRRTPKTAQLIGSVALVGLLGLIASLSDQSPFTYSGGLLLASLLTAIVLMTTISVRGPLQTVFTWKPLEWAGSRSYGIYLWHWPLLVLLRYLVPAALPAWIVPCSLIVLTFGIAELSYRFIETPIRQHGFKVIFSRAVKRRQRLVNGTMRIHARPHTAAIAICLAVILTVTSVISAPTKTSAQLNIEAGQKAIAEAKKHHPTPVKKVEKAPQTPAATVQTPPAGVPPPVVAPTDGTNISAIGDSVMLASAVALQTRLPGIAIDAEVSRSIRNGGLETIENLKASGQLRPIVVVALGTNGYYGTGNLEQLIAELQGHTIILVTAHADREWVPSNNDNAHAAAKTNKNVFVAEWDQGISAHPELLSADGIHPFGEGDTIYADAVGTALKLVK